MLNKLLSEISFGEAYRLDNAEFKGMTIQALKDIQEDIKQLQNYNNNSRYISMLIAGISGVISGIFGRRI